MTDKSGRIINPTWVNTLTEDESLIPKYQTQGSAGCDLKSAEDIVIQPGGRALVGTGIRLEIPFGVWAQVCPRSGLAIKHGVTVLNAPGVIDNDYRGEIKVVLHNSSNEEFIIKKGDRIAQLLFFPIMQAIFQRVNSISETTRGEGGFGSTGI